MSDCTERGEGREGMSRGLGMSDCTEGGPEDVAGGSARAVSRRTATPRDPAVEPAAEEPTDAPAGRRGAQWWLRRGLVGTGVLVMGYAVAGALTDRDARRIGLVVFLVAVVIGHDAVLMPIILGAGALIRRLVPGRWRAAVQAAALVSLAVSVVGLPLALGFGRPADNPSALPLAYARNLLLMLILIWAGAVVIRKGLERRRRRRTG
jgi:hypothetical protein